MISFRYHVVTLVSVFLALAVGIVLGGGPLQSEVDDSLVNQIEADRTRKAALGERIASLRSDVRFSDDFATALAPTVLDGVLEDRSVAIVQLPGSKDSLVPELTTLVDRAGGSVAGTYRLALTLLDPEQRQLVDELGKQLADGTEDVTLVGNPSAYERMGQVLGRAVGGSGSEPELDATSEALQSGLATADLVAPVGTPGGSADLVLVLAPPAPRDGARIDETDPTDSFEDSGAGEILAGLLTGVRDQVDGVVLAGPTSATERDGAIRALLADVGAARVVSTVDPVNLTTGKVATVLALAEQAAGRTGQYSGTGGAGGALPTVPEDTEPLASPLG